MEQDHRAGRALRRHDAALRDELRDRVVVDGPERIAGGAGVVPRGERALLVAAGDEHERAVELVHLVQEDRDVHGARVGHEVVVHPRAVVLVPLPDVAVEGHLPVDLELVHDVVIFEQAIVGQALDRREIAVGDVFGTLESADVVGHRAQTQIDADSIPRRQVGCRCVNEARMKQDHRSRRALGRDNAAAATRRAMVSWLIVHSG